MITPEQIEAQERKDKLVELVYSAEINPLIDGLKMFHLFKSVSAEIDYYKYSHEGYDKLMQSLTLISQGDASNDKDFLNSFVDPNNTITVLMAIGGALA